MSATITTEQANGRSGVNKAFWRILPLILIAYLFAYMDRVNVSFAPASMNEDLAFCEIGACLAPYRWGIAKDSTGSFQPALITLSIIALPMPALLLLLRHQVRARAVQLVAA